MVVRRASIRARRVIRRARRGVREHSRSWMGELVLEEVDGGRRAYKGGEGYGAVRLWSEIIS